MKYALIGCGRISGYHIRAALENDLEIAAVCDISEDRIQKLLAEHNLQNRADIKKYTDYKVMLADNKIDLLSIAAPSGLHAQIALYCIAHDINTIIEKPMAMSIEDADKIIKSSDVRNIKVAACHQNRFNIAVQKVRKAAESGSFGKLSHGAVHIRWNRDRAYYSQATWRGTWKQDGGALMNQCIHGIDLLRWMMGENIAEVYGKIRRQFHDYLETEDLGMAVVSFANGAIATIEGTTNVYPRNLEETLYLFGEKGTVKLGGKSTNNIDIWEFADQKNVCRDCKGFEEKMKNVYGNGHISLFTDMIKAIEDDRRPYVDAYEGKNAVELVLAVYKSAAEGRPVRLPLEKCGTTDFERRFFL